MSISINPRILCLVTSMLAVPVAFAEHHATGGAACEGFGPQTPRDIDNKTGQNKVVFSIAPSADKLNLCNIHFHVNAEHKAKDFAILAKGDGHGHGGGYQCNMSQALTEAELKVPEKNACQGLKPGDTIEVHWVHTSCDAKPGKGLDACLPKGCKSPSFRVESQVFTVVNDAKALNFADFSYDGNKVNELHQAKNLPTGTGTAVEFLGSTTGPKYTEQKCSPFQVTWSVRPQCAKIDINSLSKWCEGNVFEEAHAHGVRVLVTNPALLAEIQ